ncbi:arginase family protein [Enterobacteriaceae bacterium H16N7]|nr:arginase family protein [Dryocola clanedunensis]
MDDFLKFNQNVLIKEGEDSVELRLDMRHITVKLTKKTFGLVCSIVSSKITNKILHDVNLPDVRKILAPLLFNDILLSGYDDECLRFGLLTVPKRIHSNCNPVPSEQLNKWCVFGAPADFARDPPSSPVHGPYIYRRFSSSLSSLYDLGDVCFINTDNIYTFGRKISHVTKLLNEYKNASLMIGGDHSLTYFRVKQMAEDVDNLLLLHFDAHSDINTGKHKKNDILHHANFLSKIIEERCINGVIQFGVRERTNKFNASYLNNNKIQQFDCELNNDEKVTLKHLLHNRSVYVTFDMDVMDPLIFPHVTTPLDSGSSLEKVLDILAVINSAKCNIVGADIVEFTCGFNSTGKAFNHEMYIIDDIVNIITRSGEKYEK